MARVIVEFDIDNAAFEDNLLDAEIAHIMEEANEDILRMLAEADEGTSFLGGKLISKYLFDSNGNNVGEVRIEMDEGEDDEDEDDE